MEDDNGSEIVPMLTRIRAHVIAFMVEWAIIGGWPLEDVKDIIDAVDAAFDMYFTEDIADE